MTALAIGAWLEELYELSIFAVAVSAILSWPFAALTGYNIHKTRHLVNVKYNCFILVYFVIRLLIALDVVIIQRKLFLFISWSLISLVVVLVRITSKHSTY